MNLETKVCTTCEKEYLKRNNASKKQWEDSKYCGRACHWEGLNISNSYRAIHMWLAYHYEKTGVCDFCNSIGKETQRALKKGESYQKDITKYHELCVSCHKKYDFTEETRKKMSASHKGIPLPHKEKAVIATRDGKEVHFDSASKASLELGVSRTSISNAVTGRYKKAGNYTWRYG